MQRIAISVIALFGLFVTLAVTVYSQIKPTGFIPDRCPKGYYYLEQDNDGCIQEGVVTEIDGVKVDKILEVLDAHRNELHAIKGVTGTGIDRHGINVEVEPDHDKIPAEVEGLPVHTHPAISRWSADLIGYGNERGR